MANPMTDPGDLIVGGVAGAPTRQPVGSNGDVLAIAGGSPTWTPLSIPALSSATPQPLGVAAAGTSGDAARADHVHGPPEVSQTSLVLDLDADYGVTLTSSAVSAWASRVGSYSADQATAGSRPIVADWGWHGHKCVRFDGSDDILEVAHAAALDLSTPTIYVVARLRRGSTDSVDGNVVIASRPVDLLNSSPYADWSIYPTAENAVDSRFDGNNVSGTATNAHTLDRNTIYTIRTGASGSSQWVNGRRTATQASTSISYGSAAPIGIGGRATTTKGEWARVDVARVLMYSVAHTAAQRNAVLAALAQSYGVLCSYGEAL
jgi:hypothetical protein